MLHAHDLGADRKLARALLAETLPTVLSKHRDVGVSTRTPREVYLVTLASRDGSTGGSDRDVARVARHALDSLAQLHAEGELHAFRELLSQVFRWREDAFGGDLYRDVMPALELEIGSMDALKRAEWFCFDENNAPSVVPPLDLMLSIRIQRDTTSQVFLEQAAAFVQRLKSPASRFRVTMVEFALGELPLENENALRATSQLGHALLRQVPWLRKCDVSCRVPAGGEDEEGGVRYPHALGELFQVLLRVGCARLPDHQAACHRKGIADSDLSRFKLEMAHNAHPRIAAALWSAVAYSRSYSVLEFDGQLHASSGTSRNKEADTINIKFLATALLLGKSDVCRLRWKRMPVLASDADAFGRVRDAIASGDGLARVLWDRDWSLARHNLVFETATLNDEIAARLGWTMHDPGHGAWIDVFVPGFAQCSVKRDQWNRLQTVYPGETVYSGVPVEKLHLEIPTTGSDGSSFSALLTTMMGSSLTHLTVADAHLHEAGLLSLLESCPRLRHLHIAQFQPTNELVDLDTSRFVATKLETLQLAMCNVSESNRLSDALFTAVFPVIGTNLVSVRIENRTDRDWYSNERFTPMPLFAENFRSLMESSPHLEELILERLQVDRLDSLTAACRNGTSKLASLRLVKCPVESSSLVSFAEMLTDFACDGAKHLRLLYIQHSSELSEDSQLLHGLNEPSIRTLLAAARARRTLRSLLLIAQSPPSREDHDAILEEFKSFRVEDAALDESWHRDQASKALIVGLNDRNLPWNDEVVAHIFRFVPFQRRNVGVQFTRTPITWYEPPI